MTSARRALRDYERSLNMPNTVNNNNASSRGGVGVLGLAFIVLLVFKLAGQAGASWGLASLSWWVVFSPLLLGFGLFIFLLVILVILAVLADK